MMCKLKTGSPRLSMNMPQSLLSQLDTRSLRLCETICLEPLDSSEKESSSASHTFGSHGRSPIISGIEKLGGLLQVSVAKQSAQNVQATILIIFSCSTNVCQSSSWPCRTWRKFSLRKAVTSIGKRVATAVCCRGMSPVGRVSRAYMRSAA
jgi:hypothetical protein